MLIQNIVNAIVICMYRHTKQQRLSKRYEYYNHRHGKSNNSTNNDAIEKVKSANELENIKLEFDAIKRGGQIFEILTFQKFLPYKFVCV
jgi:hypothetical protein